MIIKKNDDRNLLPTDVIGSSVARSKRWLVAIVRICHEKKTGERLTKMGMVLRQIWWYFFYCE